MADKRGSLMVNGYKVGGKVDATLSSTSTNPIENQAIFKELKKYVPRMDGALNSPTYIVTNETDMKFRLATIVIGGSWCNYPIQFEVVQRGRDITTLSIIFESINSNDPNIQSFTSNGYDKFYLVKTATSTWDLYVVANEVWASISIKSIFNTLDRDHVITINTNITPVDSIPSDAIQAVNPYLTKKIKITQITQEGYNALPSTIQSDNVYLITDW